jgi:serine/threonine protein phosphatase PrpC
MLTRCIGASDFVTPDIVTGIKPAGKFLLCTDGLTKSLDDAEIARVLGSGLDGAAACEALADAAVEAGSDDDVTIILAEP